MYYESTEPLATGLLRRYALILLDACESPQAHVLRAQLAGARSNEDVIRLRGALFECMSMHLGEAEAMDRIRSLDASA